MLFKDELPPPRYTLDGDFEDKESPYNTTYSLETSCPDLSKTELILLAPRCRWLLSDFACLQIGSLTLTAETSIAEEHTAPGLYEVEVNDQDFHSRQDWEVPVYRGVQDLAVIVLPCLSESQAAFAGKAIVNKLKPAKLVLITPGLSFMDSPVSVLSTANYPAVSISAPKAQPPVIVQGSGAAAISRAQKLGLPALALVVNGDGPTNYEIISESFKQDLRSALQELLKLPATSKSKIEQGISDLYM